MPNCMTVPLDQMVTICQGVAPELMVNDGTQVVFELVYVQLAYINHCVTDEIQ